MMQVVKNSLEDADLAVLMLDVRDNLDENDKLFSSLHLKVPAIVVINKMEKADEKEKENAILFFGGKDYCKEVVAISALKKINIDVLVEKIVGYLPEGDPFFDGEDMTDLPVKFFVGEMIREKVYDLYEEEIPYHTTVLVQEFKEKTTLVKIRADIIVNRESQKGIILGEGGKMIKKLGTEARKDIENFLGQKVFLELFVKVKPKWRDNEIFLKEYGYN